MARSEMYPEETRINPISLIVAMGTLVTAGVLIYIWTHKEDDER